MAVGRFSAMVQMLVWRRTDGKYLLLRRSPTKDFGAGEWESGTGRLEQGEGFGQALRRESREEFGIDVRVEGLLGTAHFYRGAPVPENELVGLVFGCSVDDAEDLRLSDEHTEHRWMTAQEATEFLPPDHWVSRSIARAGIFRELMPEELCQLHWNGDFEL